MNGLDLSPSIAVGISLGSLITVLVFIARMAARFGALELKVDTMWAFQMRRAMSEVVEKGIGSLNSPLIFTPESRAALEPIKSRLIDFYDNKVTDTERHSDSLLLLAIERVFGNELLELVCVPCMLTHGACLLLAMAVAKQSDALEINI